MFNVTRLLNQLKSDEGFRAAPYLDSVGVWTIGYGATTYAGKAVSGRNRPITEAEAQEILKAHTLDAIDIATRMYSTFGTYTPELQEILIMLAFQLGEERLSGFVKMNAYIRSMNYVGWAHELLDSKLYDQATNRIDRYLDVIEAEAEHSY